MNLSSSVSFNQAYAGPIELPTLCTTSATELNDGTSDATTEQSYRQCAIDRWRQTFADGLYGALPVPPLAMDCDVQLLPDKSARRVILTLTLPGGEFVVDAALWLPHNKQQRGLICGLDFIGPAGILAGPDFPLDPDAIIAPRPEYGSRDGTLNDVLRGVASGSWPIDYLNAAGYAVLVSCYGSWVPDDPVFSQQRGIKPLLVCDCGAISLWAWAVSRLIDAAESMPDVETNNVIVAGHSRLGKTALWAAANDNRIRTVFAANSGAAGAAPFIHPVGETLPQLQQRFPHWLKQEVKLPTPGMDQNALLASVCPRRVYLSAAVEDLWADPIGSYLSLNSAAMLWPEKNYMTWPEPREIWHQQQTISNESLGYHLRPGGHGLYPYDWQKFLAFQDGHRTKNLAVK